MGILKGILHHWNKTSSAYDTIHPETEVSQVTDWSQGIVNTLASTALGGLVNTLTSDSLLAKMIQKVLTATGVKYNIAQDGYICFGSLFGGLIIQWITINDDTSRTATFPVAFSTTDYGITLIPLYAIAFITSLSNTNVSWKCFAPGNETEITRSISVRIIAVGY